MKIRHIAILFLPLLMQAESLKLQNIAQLRWEKRLVIAHVEGSPEAYLKQIEASSPIIEELRIAWFILAGSGLETNVTEPLSKAFTESLTEAYPTKPGDVLLVGLDSGVKSKSSSLDLEAIFSQINAMPMRQAEVRSKGTRKPEG